MYWLGDSLPLLGPEAFRYYLPRFMEFSFKHPESSAAALVLFNLVPSANLDQGERNRFANFTSEERQAVIAFVRARATLPEAEFERSDIENALSYWSNDA
jgi:hypothetical protein